MFVLKTFILSFYPPPTKPKKNVKLPSIFHVIYIQVAHCYRIDLFDFLIFSQHFSLSKDVRGESKNLFSTLLKLFELRRKKCSTKLINHVNDSLGKNSARYFHRIYSIFIMIFSFFRKKRGNSWILK